MYRFKFPDGTKITPFQKWMYIPNAFLPEKGGASQVINLQVQCAGFVTNAVMPKERLKE